MSQKIILAGCAVFDDNKRLLVIHRNKGNNVQWEMPGGKIDKGETAQQTAIRELKEELNIMVNVEKELGTKTFHKEGFEMEYTWLLATVIFGDPEVMESGHDKFEYFSLEQLNNMNDLSPNLRNFVDAYLSKEIRI